MPGPVGRAARVQNTPAAAGAVGVRFEHSGRPSPYQKVTATFDGANFVLSGDGKPIAKVDAQSGRAYDVTAADRARWGGEEGDSYMSNKKYQSVKDNGPLPEGTYTFKADRMMFFSSTEATRLIVSGGTDPFGSPMHPGDWGTGRVQLRPVNGTNTHGRDGFYVHGGVAPGSSGCIDVGNDMMNRFQELLDGYHGDITVTVKYTQEAPKASWLDRAVTRSLYPGEDASLINRTKRFFDGPDDDQ